MSIFHTLNEVEKDLTYILIQLDHDVEITVFGEDGRDVTLKGKIGDSLVLGQDGARWWIRDVVQDPDAFFTPVSDSD